MATLDTRVRYEKIQAGGASKEMKAVDRLWTAFIRLYARVTYILPISLSRLSGRLLARLAYCVLPGRRRIGMNNLDRAYGESLSRKEKVAILRASFDNFGITAAEFSRIPDHFAERGRRHVREEGIEHIDRTQGGLIVSAHLANWEWMGPSLARLGFVVAYTQLLQSAIESLIRDNPEQWMWTHNRWKLGNELHRQTELQPLGHDTRNHEATHTNWRYRPLLGRVTRVRPTKFWLSLTSDSSCFRSNHVHPP